METNNTLNRMATYDFSAPIDIVCIEENSDDEIDLTSSPKSNDKENNAEGVLKRANETILATKLEDENKKNTRKRKSDTQDSEKDNKNAKNNVNVIVMAPSSASSKKSKTLTSPNDTEEASDSLKTVSKYLTLIMESIYLYSQAAKNINSTAHDLSVKKKSYLTVKYYFFKAAYDHVNNHILPNEKNQAFIHNFLNYTISMAENKIKVNCNKDITELYFEMMSWVKQRKLKDFSDNCKTPTLVQRLNDPPVIPNITITESQTNVSQHFSSASNQAKLCIFSSGPPGRQISITANKTLLADIDQVPENTRVPQIKAIHQNIKDQQNLRNKTLPSDNFPFRNVNNLEKSFENRQIYNGMIMQQNDHTQPLVPENGYRPIPDNRMSPYVHPLNHSSNYINENNQSSVTPRYNYYHTTNNIQNNSYYTANNFIHNGNSLVPNKGVPDGNLRMYRMNHHHPRPDMRGPLPPYYSPIAMQPNPVMQPVTPAPTILPGLPNGPDFTRSSVSTDSGFVSPVGSKSSTNPIEDIMNDLFELENSVEQLRTAEPSEAVCHVCHKHAKLMCAACFKTTYCNAKCQRIDWEVHKLSCSPPTGRRRQ